MSAEVISMEEFKSGHISHSEFEEYRAILEWGMDQSAEMLQKCDDSSKFMAILQCFVAQAMWLTSECCEREFEGKEKELFKQMIRDSVENGFKQFEEPCPHCGSE